MTEREQKMFGISVEDIKTQYMQSLTAELTGMEMVVMGVLSDAQEILAPEWNPDGVEAHNANRARQMINCAKAIVFDLMDKETA